MRIVDLLNNSEYKEKFVLQKLICRQLLMDRNDIRVRGEEEIAADVVEKIISDYKKYADEKMPMEYILGEVEFFGKKFVVNQNTLIPRPETEYMIEAVVEEINNEKGIMNNSPEYGNKNLLMDIGTGCGVLGTSVLIQQPGVFDRVVVTDIADETLAMAKKNFVNYFPSPVFSVDFWNTSMLNFVKEGKVNLGDFENIILVSNAPYIPDETLETEVQEHVKKREPKVALVGGKDGLDLYRILLKQLVSELDNIKNLSLFFEMMTWQCDVLRKEFEEWFEFEEVKTFHANIRIVKGMVKS